MNLKRLSVFLGIVLALSTLIGGLFTLDRRWAKADSVQQLSIRLEQKILEDRQFALQERIWRLEDRYRSNPAACPPEVKMEIRNLKHDLQLVDKKLKKLNHKE
jgi:hypothetical protein